MLLVYQGVLIPSFLFIYAYSVDPTNVYIPRLEDKVYVYEWPEYLTNLWPNYTISTDDMKNTARNNHGTGPFLNASIGLHETFQFSVFTTFYHRLLLDPRRTHDPAEATAFFIPYDIGFDAAISKKAKVRTPGCPRAEEITSLLSESKYFRRNHGHDHFIVHGINQAMGAMNRRAGCSLFLKLVCENCTKLAIDTYPKCGESPNWNAIPFPGNVHWSSAVTYVPWSDPYSRRAHIVSFTGTASSHSRKTTNIRTFMRNHCRNHSACHMNEMQSHASAALPPNWATALDSVFCMTPPGDMPTRKGFFDSILLGCIPVVCDKYSAHYQWRWNLGLDAALATVVYIPCSKFRPEALPGFDFINYLVDMYTDGVEVTMRRQAIARHAAALQYRLPESDELLKSKGITPPPDAYDVIMSRIYHSFLDMPRMVANPTDHGDFAGVDVFPDFPIGRYVQDFSLANYTKFKKYVGIGRGISLAGV